MVANEEPGEKLAQRARKGIAVCWVAPLLALALTHCGGNSRNEPLGSSQAGSVGTTIAGAASGGERSTEHGAISGSSAGGSAGRTGDAIEIDPSLIDPAGGQDTPGACNGLAFGASAARASVVVDAPPEPQGGAILDGTYNLTKHEEFVGIAGGGSNFTHSAFGTLVISESTGDRAQLQLAWEENQGELPIPFSQSQTIATTGTVYDYTVTCMQASSSPSAGSLFYTATVDQLIWIYPASGGVTRVETFTRNQPR